MNTKPEIAIIGANESIDKLICRAKEKGYETHVFAWECGDPGEKSADYFYPVSIADKEKILEICKNLSLQGVASITSDFAVNTVNYVARQLGLVCNSKKTDELARNKYLMRTAFKKCGIYTPYFLKVDRDTNLKQFINHEFPVIVKPTDRWSSKGVTRVDRYEELKSAVDYAISESLSGEAIVENFMNGPEYSAECICQDGKYYILAYTQKSTTGFPHYVETGHIQPANITYNLIPRIEKTIKKALDALDIKNSAAHVEFKIIDGEKIGIIEIGARMGGDFIGTDLVKLSTGYDYIGMTIDVACGQPINFSRIKSYSYAEVKFILNQNDYQNYLDYAENHNDEIESFHLYETEFIHQVKNSSDRYGYYIIRK